MARVGAVSVRQTARDATRGSASRINQDGLNTAQRADHWEPHDDEEDRIRAAVVRHPGAGDFDTAETMLTDDFFIIEAEGLPMAGEFRGKTALRDLYSMSSARSRLRIWSQRV